MTPNRNATMCEPDHYELAWERYCEAEENDDCLRAVRDFVFSDGPHPDTQPAWEALSALLERCDRSTLATLAALVDTAPPPAPPYEPPPKRWPCGDCGALDPEHCDCLPF